MPVPGSLYLRDTDAQRQADCEQKATAITAPRRADPVPATTLRQTLKADLAVNDARGIIVLVLFRTASCAALPAVIRRPVGIFYTILVCWFFGIDLPVGTSVGPGLRLNHSTGLVVHRDAVIGAHCDIKHGCTVGLRVSGGEPPVLRDGVVLGAGSHVVGGITLGENAEVGAGAVVLTDVPPDHIAVGNPARVLPRRSPKAYPLGGE